MNDGHSSIISVVLDIVARHYYEIIIAVTVIGFLQFRSNFLTLVNKALNNGIQQTFLNLALNLADIFRGCYQISRDLIRSVGNYIQNPFPQGDSIHMQYNDKIHGRNGNRNILECGERILSYGSLPPLVIMKNDDSPVIAKTVSSSATIANGLEPLEPAFLNEDDYPPNWPMYHRTLGVTTKDEADHYDRQHLSRKLEENPSQTEESDLVKDCHQQNSNITCTKKLKDDIIDDR
mmetsp:Transcript_37467/g.41909  ORF Transcript_37467/g.41909 Transcript_37467/m.41909 type:complete len:234 (+) Transcript_37467:96-797(+)